MWINLRLNCTGINPDLKPFKGEEIVPTTTYTIVHGEVLTENRNGTERAYLFDVIGSTMAIADSSQAITDTFSYWPFGEQKSHIGPSATPLQFLGVYGARKDSVTRIHIGARELRTSLARWSQQDRLYMDRTRYSYALDNPVNYRDSSGFQAELAPTAPPPLYLVEGGGLGFWGTRVGAIPVIGGMIIGGIGGAYFGDWADRASNGGWSRFWGNVMYPGFGDLIDPNREWYVPPTEIICASRRGRGGSRVVDPNEQRPTDVWGNVAPLPVTDPSKQRGGCPPCPPPIEYEETGSHFFKDVQMWCCGLHRHKVEYDQLPNCDCIPGGREFTVCLGSWQSTPC